MTTSTDSKKPVVWLTGASGQLGSAILRLCPEQENFSWLSTTREEVDLTKYSQVSRFLRTEDPAMVVNAAAYTDVDGAESLGEEELFRINVLPMMQVHELRPEMPILQISTDYVFGGEEGQTKPYEEEDVADPLGAYGRSKNDIEQYLLANHPQSYILRTSWLYGPRSWSERRSFYRSISERVSAGEEICCVEDEVGSPTSTLTLARVIIRIVSQLMCTTTEERLPYGLYNVADRCETSRIDLARAIAREQTGSADYPITPIRQAELTRPARRPHYSPLSTTKIEKYYPDLIRPWEEALHEVITLDHTSEK